MTYLRNSLFVFFTDVGDTYEYDAQVLVCHCIVCCIWDVDMIVVTSYRQLFVFWGKAWKCRFMSYWGSGTNITQVAAISGIMLLLLLLRGRSVWSAATWWLDTVCSCYIKQCLCVSHHPPVRTDGRCVWGIHMCVGLGGAKSSDCKLRAFTLFPFIRFFYRFRSYSYFALSVKWKEKRKCCLPLPAALSPLFSVIKEDSAFLMWILESR